MINKILTTVFSLFIFISLSALPVFAQNPGCPFEPYYSDLTNLTPDPECTDVDLWGGWGLKSVVGADSAYCDTTAILLTDPTVNDCDWPNGDAALDVSDFEWQPNTIYHLRAMVKTYGGSIGFLARGSVDNSGLPNDFNFSVDTDSEWVQIDTIFTTSASPSTGFFSFNTCDNSTCTEAYIDNYEMYAIGTVCVFEPYYSDLTNLTPDPECTDVSLWGGWGLKRIVTGDSAACGDTAIVLEDPTVNDCDWPNGDAALDVSDFEWQPNTIYHLRAMVKTYGGSIGFLARGSVDNSGLPNDFNFSVDTDSEWVQIDTIFTTSASPSTGFFSFNTCDNSTCTEAYIDNYEMYAIGTVCVFEPYYSDLTNLTPDPECTDVDLWGGWGLKRIVTGDSAACGDTAIVLEDPTVNDCDWPNGDAALDVSDFEWQANTTYHLRAMVKTYGGSIGFLARGSVDNSGLPNDFNFSVDTDSEWVQIDTMFTTSASPSTGFFSFNTCDNSTCTEAYIDNYEMYAISVNAIDIESNTRVIPTAYVLEQNYPNPFNPKTNIRFSLPMAGKTTLKVYNLMGQLILTLIDRDLPAGIHTVSFNAASLSSGVYFYSIESGNFHQVKKMQLVK